MKIIKISILAVFSMFLLASCLVFAPQSALAQDEGAVWDNQIGTEAIGAKFGQSDNLDSIIDVRVAIVRIIDRSLTFLGIIFVALMIFSGYQWMTAGGNEEQVEKAKKRITNLAIGLVIILASWSITNFIIRRAVCAVGKNYNYSYCSSLVQ